MASYLEIHLLRSNSDLQEKLAVAAVKKAQSLLDGPTPTADEVSWASSAIQSPSSKSGALLNYVLAKNSDLTVAQIVGASDSAIQSQVNDAVDALIAGGAV